MNYNLIRFTSVNNNFWIKFTQVNDYRAGRRKKTRKMKKVFIAVVTIGLLLKVCLSTASGHHESLGFGDRRMEDDYDNTVVGYRCCHSDSLQGSIQSYPLNLMPPTVYRFYYDRNSRRLAFTFDSDQRQVTRCSDDRVCVVSLIDDRKRSCFQTKHIFKTLDDFWGRCVPNEARRLERLQIGGRLSGQSPLKVQMVEYLKDGLVYRKLVDVVGCSPIADLADITGKGAGGYSSRFYFDLESKIRNRTVFDIPWFCTRIQNSD